jgi:hypothetical protein
MAYRRYNQRPRPTSGARWLDVKFAGECSRCGTAIAKGARAIYDYGSKSLTCSRLDCAEAAGFTKAVWNGSPVSGSWGRTLTERQLSPSEPVRDPGEDMADRWNERGV